MAGESAISDHLLGDLISTDPDVLLDSCRVCMARNVSMHPIFEDQNNTISEKVYYCTGILFTKGDGLPTLLCTACLQDLSVAHRFKSMCLHSHEAFQNILSQSINRIKMEPDDLNYDNDHLFYPPDEEESDVDNKPALIDILIDNKERVTRSKVKKESKSLNSLKTVYKKTKKSYKKSENRKVCRIPCKACDLTFRSKKKFLEHRRNIHNEATSYMCEHCGQSFSSVSLHDAHLQTHIELAVAPSSYTPKYQNLKLKAERKSRKRLMKMKFRRLHCETCDIKFKTKTESDEHKKTHHNEPRSYMCEICGLPFGNASTLYTHVRSHRPPQFQCDHCDYSSTSKHDLSKHLRVHSGLKPYQCESCPSSYHTISNLKDHIRRLHEGIKRYQCHLCDKRFYDRTKLNRHLDSHDNVKRFLCHVCHSKFTRRCYWKKHLEQKHSIVIPRQRPGRQPHGVQVWDTLAHAFGDKE